MQICQHVNSSLSSPESKRGHIQRKQKDVPEFLQPFWTLLYGSCTGVCVNLGSSKQGLGCSHRYKSPTRKTPFLLAKLWQLEIWVHNHCNKAAIDCFTFIRESISEKRGECGVRRSYVTLMHVNNLTVINIPTGIFAAFFGTCCSLRQLPWFRAVV